MYEKKSCVCEMSVSFLYIMETSPCWLKNLHKQK